MADSIQDPNTTQEALDKGKGKAAAPAGAEVNMETEEDTSSEEELDDVRYYPYRV